MPTFIQEPTSIRDLRVGDWSSFLDCSLLKPPQLQKQQLTYFFMLLDFSGPFVWTFPALTSRRCWGYIVVNDTVDNSYYG